MTNSTEDLLVATGGCLLPMLIIGLALALALLPVVLLIALIF